MSILKRGLSGEPVKVLQTKLGVTADGIFGPGTEAALREYQKQHKLLVDGVAGPDTFAQMGLFELVLLAPGTVGDSVKKLQTALGVTADGHFGPATQKALREFQAKNGLDADGLAGPATLAKISSFKEMTAEVIKKSEAGPGASHAARKRCARHHAHRRCRAAGAEEEHLGTPVRSQGLIGRTLDASRCVIPGPAQAGTRNPGPRNKSWISGSRCARPGMTVKLLPSLQRRERLLEIADDVLRILDADREPHHVRAGARLDLLRVGELAVRRRGRVDDQRARVADIGEVREQLQVGDELDAGLVAALEAEGEHGAGALRHVAFCASA